MQMIHARGCLEVKVLKRAKEEWSILITQAIVRSLRTHFTESYGRHTNSERQGLIVLRENHQAWEFDSRFAWPKLTLGVPAIFT
jgi:hypothetical protein